ncbi:DNA polymerase I family protein with 3'-5'-exonuclease and polymerase domains [Saccharomonospora marina XMU15]|uniref:DNA-directed DNA polymerase n=1 Tax=Saccharomonospora marina XMU15 TaxID=882083 RepID=H5X5K6_9PSEU|nr:bifunctional 3'-5' exonuclease/DNA polymerase [Saccharomonospora marina]EHR50078.1 DNA polymerase I family protein with 3'-5'-exonuclease and polymerase domains [Saccharomonospora marina XMU15]
MLLIVVREADGYALRPLGGREAVPEHLGAAEFADLAVRWEREFTPRWVFTSVERDYAPLVAHGVRLGRCHDLALAEYLLLAHEGLHEQSRGLAAAYARANGLPTPTDTGPDHFEADSQPTLFDPTDPGLPEGVSTLDAAEQVLASQQRRINGLPRPDRMRLLVAAESASALAAVEMSADGLPWRADVHDLLLTELLGEKAASGLRPRRLAELAQRIQQAFGGRPVNPDHPGSVVRAFSHAGIEVPSTRAHVLRRIDHPAVAPLLEYKELARLHSAHGWAWLDQWVRDDRFRPVYVVGGVVSGRWASRGGAALQIPKVLRSCVRADPGWKLVVADAAQLEPRILAALSGDRELARVSESTDLYTSLATAMFARSPSAEDRQHAKIAMLSAMYGSTAGEAASLLVLLRQRFPTAVSYVENAALEGERGELVRSRLGRTSPPPSAAWRALTGGGADEEKARRAARDWGRFTRNFVVQASAADWTAVLLAALRRSLPAPASLVFFQHDEVVVHSPTELAHQVCAALDDAVAEATALVFGPACPVRFPMPADVVDRYDEAR